MRKKKMKRNKEMIISWRFIDKNRNEMRFYI